MGGVKLAWAWLQVAGGVLAGVALLWLAAQTVFHLRLLNVQTGSMRPTFRPHDALIMQRIQPAQLRPGMIVSYQSLRNPGELVTHRVVALTPGGFQTKGDALNQLDPTVPDDRLVGQVAGVLPGLGRPLGWLRSWAGLVICVYIPAAAVILSELRRLEQHYARLRPYQLAGWPRPVVV